MDMNSNPYYETGQPYGNEQLVQKVMSRTFLFMFGVLLLSGVSSVLTLYTGFYFTILTTPFLFYGLLIAELILVFAGGNVMSKNLVVPSAILLFLYSIVNGITLSYIFVLFDLGSVVSIFFMSATIFGIMAIFGIITKRDLSSLGSIGMMGLIGIIVVGLINIVFLQSETLSLFTAVIGVAVFIGLTAYDCQKIKQLASSNAEINVNTLAMYGALMLYLDFVNIFLKLLRLFGKRR